MQAVNAHTLSQGKSAPADLQKNAEREAYESVSGQRTQVHVGVEFSGLVEARSPASTDRHVGRFFQRNRIISASCLGVVVVEAAPRSGSLSTAHHAMEQNREVFAVPSPVDSLATRGCHRLIRDCARLVETIDDILEELRPLVRKVRPPDEPRPPSRRAGSHRSGALTPGPA
jgi:predicted Rossmann fold nucleotide-binding protein DprA/Smf involved in DNA uptake